MSKPMGTQSFFQERFSAMVRVLRSSSCSHTIQSALSRLQGGTRGAWNLIERCQSETKYSACPAAEPQNPGRRQVPAFENLYQFDGWMYLCSSQSDQSELLIGAIRECRPGFRLFSAEIPKSFVTNVIELGVFAVKEQLQGGAYEKSSISRASFRRNRPRMDLSIAP
jgi:hypothetical protein